MLRTPASFADHLSRRVAQCGRTYVLLRSDSLLGREFVAVPHSCDSNYCDRCRARRLRLIRDALYRSLARHRWRLVTLTFDHRLKTPADQLAHCAKAFRRLTLAMRRRYPNTEYVRTIEVHQDGYPHIHMIVDCFIPIAWLQLAWIRAGGGHASITERKKKKPHKTPCGHRQAAHYLTDELEKKSQDPHRLGVHYWCSGLRSISVSRSLSLRNPNSQWQFEARGLTLADLEDKLAELRFSRNYYGELEYSVQWQPSGAFLIGHGFAT